MGKVLITKLDVTYNNPDAPVIEMMNDFTLAAIQASGNDSMTLEQQYALNHFFYQIGAFSNSGIFAKIDYLYLPFIAGDLETTVVNYKDNSVSAVPSSSLFSFANKAINYIGESSGDNIVFDNAYTRSSLKMSFAAITSAVSSEIFRNGSQTVAYAQRYVNPKTSVVISKKIMVMSASEELLTEVFGASLDDANSLYIGQQVAAGNIRTNVTTDSAAVDLGASYVARLRINQSVPLKAAAIGDYLTSDELSTLLLELNTLKTAFSA